MLKTQNFKLNMINGKLIEQYEISEIHVILEINNKNYCTAYIYRISRI